jgi:hypothetical protein
LFVRYKKQKSEKGKPTSKKRKKTKKNRKKIKKEKKKKVKKNKKCGALRSGSRRGALLLLSRASGGASSR